MRSPIAFARRWKCVPKRAPDACAPCARRSATTISIDGPPIFCANSRANLPRTLRLSRSTSHKPEPSKTPAPLPRGLISGQLARGRMLLCLDFDGTLAELTNDPWKAAPLPRAKEAVAELARHPQKLTVAIISGRDLNTLLALLGLRGGLLFAGTHGLEFIG